MPIALDSYRKRIADLAADGVFIGTSSWKYPGWVRTGLHRAALRTRNKFSNAKFERSCLAEYAETYRTVCVDAGYYQFPTEQYLSNLCGDVPDGFRFGFKATDER